MIKHLFARKPQPETVLKSEYDALKLDYNALKNTYELSTAAHKEVIEERNQAGTLLLDCLSLLRSITISKRQNSLIIERETLVERAKELGWLPGREEESKHATV